MAVTREEKTGVIESFYDVDSGVIRENGTNATRDFFQPGAQTQFIQAENVVYILITLPNNRTIVQGIGKPPQ
ncbi:MAG: hypothetical protein H7141_02445 [Burkholderiales bacterium]|nr:hypothetical protein [Bacteroidia bacterium]